MFHKPTRQIAVAIPASIFFFSLLLASYLHSPIQAATEPASNHISPNATDEILIPTGATWRYLDDGSDQGVAWYSPTFDDSTWATGPAKLGYGNGNEATLLSYGPDPNNKYITTYFRHTFQVTDTTIYQGLHLNLLRDDGAIVYLNGTELVRTNMPTGTITYTTLASTRVEAADESTYFNVDLSPNNLVTGTNVIAVEIHQAAGDSPNINFDLELVAEKALWLTFLPVIINDCSHMLVDFAVIGDYGDSGGNARDVAALVRSWYPDFIITLGDNNYPAGEAETIDKNIGQHYYKYIGNYTGRFGRGAAINYFYPALGNHDWRTVSGHPPLPRPYLDYFTLPGNERYYNFRRGPVELFTIDSNPQEPHGRSRNSYQAIWLRNQLAASDAPWKLVYMHHPPYSSTTQSHGSELVMQWPYKSWGATAVLAGHNHTYERLLISGFPYFVNGLGGRGKHAFKGQPLAGSEVRYAGDYGAMWVRANKHCINFQFITRTGLVIDDYTIVK